MARTRPQDAGGKGADVHAGGREADRRTAVAIEAEPRGAVEAIGRRIGARCADAHARGAALAADGQGGLGKARADPDMAARGPDRKSVVQGKSGAVRVDFGGRRIIKNKKNDHNRNRITTKY